MPVGQGYGLAHVERSVGMVLKESERKGEVASTAGSEGEPWVEAWWQVVRVKAHFPSLPTSPCRA